MNIPMEHSRTVKGIFRAIWAFVNLAKFHTGFKYDFDKISQTKNYEGNKF